MPYRAGNPVKSSLRVAKQNQRRTTDDCVKLARVEFDEALVLFLQHVSPWLRRLKRPEMHVECAVGVTLLGRPRNLYGSIFFWKPKEDVRRCTTDDCVKLARVEFDEWLISHSSAGILLHGCPLEEMTETKWLEPWFEQCALIHSYCFSNEISIRMELNNSFRLAGR